MSKERPILFSAPMVRALLDGSKTQTRRILKHPILTQPPYFFSGETKLDLGYPASVGEFWAGFRYGDFKPTGRPEIDGSALYTKCPYGKPGDRIWVRETFRLTDTFDPDSPARVAERCIDAVYKTPWAPIQYEVDGTQRDWHHVGTPPHDGTSQKAGKTRVSIHMPRWASRILLEIVSVRVERLTDISEADARAEGVECKAQPDTGIEIFKLYDQTTFCASSARHSFETLWESINGTGSWGANPWVWVIEFKKVA